MVATSESVAPAPVSIGRVVRGFGGLAAASLASQIIGFAALAYVARRVGASNLGAYTFALILATYFNLLASVGIDYLATRDVAQDASRIGSIVGETLALQGLLSVVLYGALVISAPLLVADHQVRSLLPIVGLVMLTTTLTVDWALLALGRSRSVALWRLVGQGAYAVLVPLLLVGGSAGVLRYAWFNIVGLAVTSLGLLWAFWRVVGARLRVSGPRALLRRFRRSIPFGYSLVMIQIYGGIGTLMLGYLDSTHEVGIYAVASKLPWALIAFANLWLNVFFPHTARGLLADAAGFARDLGQVLTATAIIAMAVAVGAFLCSGSLMTTMFGARFQAAALPFAILSCAAALVLLQANLSNVLLAGGSQRHYTAIMTLAAVSIIILNLILIPLLGAMGAAISTVAAELGLTTLTLMAVRRRIGPVRLDLVRLLRGTAAVGLMAVAMLSARSLGGAIIQVGIALPIFAAAAWAFRAFDPALIQN
jgi:O-antigen/teichoic acid export membrane protein